MKEFFGILRYDGVWVKKFDTYLDLLCYFRKVRDHFHWSLGVHPQMLGNSFKEIRSGLVLDKMCIWGKNYYFDMLKKERVQYIVKHTSFGIIQNYQIMEDLDDYVKYPIPVIKQKRNFRFYGRKRSRWRGYKYGSNVSERRRIYQDRDEVWEYSLQIKCRNIDPWDENIRGDYGTNRNWKSHKMKKQWMKHFYTHKDNMESIEFDIEG